MSDFLYRHYDGNGQLLYIGISLCAVARLAQHRQKSSWVDDIRLVKIERCSSRNDASRKELKAIQAESPLFNKKMKIVEKIVFEIDISPPSGQSPICKCGKTCAYYGEIGGFSVKCEECNASHAAYQRIARARRAGKAPKRKNGA